MTREEREQVIERAAQAGAFEEIWRNDWRPTNDYDREVLALARILLLALSLVEEVPTSTDEAAVWCWAALAWSTARAGNRVNFHATLTTTFIEKVDAALWKVSTGESVAPFPEVE